MEGTARQTAGAFPRRFSVVYKLAIIFTVLTTSGMVLLGLLVVREQTRLLEQQINEFGVALVSHMAQTAQDALLANDALSLEVITRNLHSHERVLGAAIYSDEMQPIAKAGRAPDDGEVAEVLAGGEPLQWQGTVPDTERPQRLISFHARVVFGDLTIGYALLTLDRSYLDSALHRTVRMVVAATVILVLLGIAASIILSRRVARPINTLMRGSQLISEGDHAFRFKEQRNDELGALMRSLNAMNEGLLRKEQVELVFSRYVSAKVAAAVLQDLERIELGGRHVNASVLFADIVGFTSMSEGMTPGEVSAILNDYFGYIARVARVFHGHVDKYIGDCAMLVFGVPGRDERHGFHAVASAVLIQRIVEGLNQRRRERGQFAVEFRIGVNSGAMLAGNMGSIEHMNYTVVGDAVNLASRLASVAGAGQIIIGKQLFEPLHKARQIVGEQHGTIQLRGKKQPVATYRVTGLAGRHGARLDELLRQMLGAAEAPL